MSSDSIFENIDYLKDRNEIQRRAYKTLTKYKILKSLKEFDPILVGTIPINIDIENSDLDIICYFKNKTYFEKLLVEKFGDSANFKIWENTKLNPHSIVASFILEEFEIELFGQNIPTRQQNGYRHMIIENRLIKEGGENFRQRIIHLKQEGYKTEPAFCIELGLKGNPYEALLEFESNK
jgi:hypothetical protein